jgi:hypothetical protein
VCHSHGVYDIRTATADQARRHFIGTNSMKGDKAKKLVQAQCEHLGWSYATADEADALALWSYGCELLRPGSGFAYQPMLEVGAPTAAPKLRKLPQARMTAKEANELLFKRGK